MPFVVNGFFIMRNHDKVKIL